MKVYLSYAYGPLDGPIAARLRAVAAIYGISILLPDQTLIGKNLAAETEKLIKQSDAVIALISKFASRAAQKNVERELQYAMQLGKPVIPMVEEPIKFSSLPNMTFVYFDRNNPARHEAELLQVLNQIRTKKQKQDLTAVGWIAGIALGLLVLNQLTAETK